MRKYIVFALLFMMILLAACKNNDEAGEPSNTLDDPDGSEHENVISNPTGKELVWLVYDDMTPDLGVDPEVFNAFNKLLLEKGADYTVQFVGFDPIDVEGYQQRLLDMKENGEQVDLLMTGFGTETIQSNLAAVTNELIDPLDDYLSTEKGQQLYAQFDEKVWERIKVKDTIYGINNQIDFYFPPTLFMNEQVVDDLGLTAPKEITSLDQLDDLLQQVSTQSDDIVPFGFPGFSVRQLTGYSFFNTGIAADYLEDGQPYAFNPFEVDEVKTLLHTFSHFSKEGYWDNTEETNDQIAQGDFFTLVDGMNPLTYDDGVLSRSEGRSVQAKAYEFGDHYIEPLLNGMTGIASWSTYKEEAFDLLTRINTDPELSNMLYHGIEGEHYTLEDGFAKMINNDFRVPGYGSPANELIVYPAINQPKNKDEMMRDWLASAKLSPLVGFHLDETPIADELANIQTIYDDFYDLWMVVDVDIDERIEAANQALTEAGIDDVLAEINDQLQEWWTEKQ